MSFNTLAPAQRLLAILGGLSGLHGAQIGAPEKVDSRVTAYISMGSQQPTRKAQGLVQRQGRYFVMFAYRVDGNEGAAETTLMGLVDAFLMALYADLTLAGTCKSIEIDIGLADEPYYRLTNGQEYREYPVVIAATQQANYTVNPS
jgi:hypothetical protein